MKTKKFALLIILSMLVTGFAGAGSYIVEDDIYYNPNDKNPVVEKKEKEAQKELQEKAAVKKTLMATSDNHFRDVDEYNRRGESSDMTLEDIAANQKEDYVEYNVVDENGDDGYYLNGFNGSDSDYEYALRIRRFHNPKFVVSVSDPFYSDIYFLDNNDWNVYISDNYAWVTPTWTNPWYWNYTWAPYSYSSLSWRWNFGFGSWGFSWGYGYPGWGYNPYWGWAGPWYSHWGWGGHHHHPGYYPGHRPGWNNGRDIRYSNGGRTTYGNYGSSNRYSGGRNTINTRPSSTGNKYTPGSSPSSKQPIMRETNSNRGRTRIGTSSGNSTYNRPSGTTNRRSTYTPGSSSGRTSGSSSRVRNSSGGRSTYTPSSTQRRESGSSYRPSTSRSSGSSGSVGRSSGGSRGRTR